MLRKEYKNIDTIVVGSSHGDFGFNPAYYKKSFNMCFRSQDLKYSFYLYENIAKKYNKINRVIVFYSLFSPGFLLEKSSEKYIGLAANNLFNLDIKYEDKILSEVAKIIQGKFDDFDVEIEEVNGFMPWEEKNFIPETYGAKKRALEHLEFNNKDEANIYLKEIILLAKKLGHKVCIVIPPARLDYRAACEANASYLFRSLFEVLKNVEYDVDVANLFEDNKFSDDDFGDYDHLLPFGKGVEILTRAVYDLTNPCAAVKNQ